MFNESSMNFVAYGQLRCILVLKICHFSVQFSDKQGFILNCIDIGFTEPNNKEYNKP